MWWHGKAGLVTEHAQLGPQAKLRSVIAYSKRTGTSIVAVLDGLIIRERVRNYSAIFTVVSFLIFVNVAMLAPLFRMGEGGVMTPDFLAHWTGGRLLLQGQTDHLYEPLVQQHLQTATVGSTAFSWFVSPPFAAALYAPLAALNYPVAAFLWMVISAICLVLAIRSIRPWAPQLFAANGRVVWLAIFAAEPVLEFFGSGQESALTLLVWVLGIRLMLAGRQMPAGVVFALGLFKPQQFLLVPIVLLLRRQYRALLAWLTTALALAGASVLLVGVNGTLTWLKVPFSPFYEVAAQVDMAWKMQSVPSLVIGLMPTSMGGVSAKLGLLASMLLMALFARQVAKHKGEGSELAVWMLAMLVTVLSSPHLGIYDLVLLVPPVLFVLDRASSPLLRVAVVLAYALTWSHFLRHGIASSLPWPLSTLEAAWAIVPIALFWKPLLGQMERNGGSASHVGRLGPVDSVLVGAQNPHAITHSSDCCFSAAAQGNRGSSGTFPPRAPRVSQDHASRIVSSPRGS